MEDKESLFEMRYRAYFAQEAPVLMTDTRVYESKDLFGADGAVLETVIADLSWDHTHLPLIGSLAQRSLSFHARGVEEGGFTGSHLRRGSWMSSTSLLV